MPTATADEVKEAPDNPPVTTMATWMKGMEEIGPMVEKQPAAPKVIEGVGEVRTKKEGDDGKTGQDKPADVAAGQPAAPASDKPAEPKTGAAAGDGKGGEGDVGEEQMPRTNKQWKEFKAGRKAKEDLQEARISELDTKLKEAEAKLTELSNKPAKTEPDGAVKAELESLKEANQELSRRLAAADTLNHPTFIRDFIEPIKAQVELAKKIVGTEKAEQIAKILTLPDSEYKSRVYEEFEADLTSIQQRRLGGVLNELDVLAERKQKALTDTETWAKNAEAAKTLSDQERAKQEFTKREKSFSDTLGAVIAHPKIDLFKPKDGDDAWNKGLNERVARAKDLYLGKGKLEEMAGAALFAVSMPLLIERYNKDLKTRDDTIGKLEAQIKTLTAAQPGGDKGHGAGGPETGKGEGDGVKEGSTPREAMNSFVKSMHSMLRE